MEERQKYGAVPVAYELSLKSMETIHKRYEAQDSNLDRVLVLVSTFSAAVVAVLAKLLEGHPNFHSPLLYGGVLCFVSSLVVAFEGKFDVGVNIIDPQKLYEGHLNQEEYEFKMDHIWYLSENFRDTSRATNKKRILCINATILFCLELACLISWVVLDI